jgi:hypothetical protein
MGGNGQVGEYMNDNQLGVKPLIKGEFLFDYVMDGLNIG